MKVQPKPAHAIPIWVGGRSEPAYRRAADARRRLPRHRPRSRGRGACRRARLRRDRPEESFTISLRTGWDPQGMEPDVIRRERDEFEAAGIQHVVSAPWRNDLDELAAVDGAARRARARPTERSAGGRRRGHRHLGARSPALNASMSVVGFGDRRRAVDVGDRTVASCVAVDRLHAARLARGAVRHVVAVDRGAARSSASSPARRGAAPATRPRASPCCRTAARRRGPGSTPPRGCPRCAAILAAPTVPERSTTPPRFWPALMPDITTLGFTPSWSRAAVTCRPGSPCTAVAS